MSASSYSGTLTSAAQATHLFAKLLPRVIAMIADGAILTLEIFDGKTRKQERLYHSIFKDFAAQLEAPLVGKTDPESWKRLMLDGFYRATKDDPELASEWEGRAPRVIPNLDLNGFVSIDVQSRSLSKILAMNFITHMHAWGDERGVVWSKTSLGRDWPDAS